MTSSPITLWQIDVEIMETVTNFIFLGSKITADGEIKRSLLLGRKDMTNLESILKRRDITLPTKVHLVRAMVFPVVMNGCESWPMKKAECQRINASELGSWRRLLRAPWTAACQASLSCSFLELAQTHVHRVSDAIQPSHPLLSPSPPAFNLSQCQGLFQ